MTAEIKMISLGWGVQSWTLAAMVALGELEPVDFAMHSDTGHEMSYTYEFAIQWTPWLEDHGVKVITVTGDYPVVNQWNQTYIPAFTYHYGSDGQRSKSQLKRMCTGNWKILPMRRVLRDMMKEREIKVLPGTIEQWMGITYDEVFRAKESDAKYLKSRFPFLEMKWTRQHCMNWLMDHKLPMPGKSSCVFCPYHSKRFREQMKREGGLDWALALEADRQIRDLSTDGLYIHQSRLPLDQAVAIPEDDGFVQMEMFSDSDVCDSGYCFL